MIYFIINDIAPEDLVWAHEPIIGSILVNAEIDSWGKNIKKNMLYKIARHIPTSRIILIRWEDWNNQLNQDLKLNGQLN